MDKGSFTIRGRVSLDQQVQYLKSIKINNANDAMKVIPLINNINSQINRVLAQQARQEVFRQSIERTATITPAPAPEAKTAEQIVETRPETPGDLPFNEDVDTVKALDLKAELVSAKETKTKKTTKKARKV